MGRREYGTGSVYQRKDGLWVGTVEAGWTAAGTRRRIPVYGKTRAIAQQKLRDRRRQIEAEGLPTVGARVTVKRYSEDWLESTRTSLRSGPWQTNASAVRRWVVPTIGHKRLEDLTPADVRAVTAAQRRAGLKSSTARRTHITLTAMLKAAMVDGHQVPARVLLVKAPETSANDMEAMSDAELEAVMNVAVEHLPHWSRWLVQVMYGQRPAEILGLTWEAIDFDAGVIRIEWQLQALPYVDRSNKALGYVVPDGMKVRHLVDGWHLTPPKTKKGYRLVPLLPIVREALLAWRDVAPPSPHGLVWPTLTGRPANDKHDLTEWHALQGTAEIGHPSGRYFKIYEARHAFATRLLEEGVDPAVIEQLMGHSSILTSRGYMHVGTQLALDALQKVGGRLELREAAR